MLPLSFKMSSLLTNQITPETKHLKNVLIFEHFIIF